MGLHISLASSSLAPQRGVVDAISPAGGGGGGGGGLTGTGVGCTGAAVSGATGETVGWTGAEVGAAVVGEDVQTAATSA